MNNFTDGEGKVYFNSAKNGFSCPYPQHSKNIILLKSACGIRDMATVITIPVVILLVVGALVGGLVYGLYKRGTLKSCVDRIHATYRKFGPRVIGYSVYLALVALFVYDVYADVVQYRATKSKLPPQSQVAGTVPD